MSTNRAQIYIAAVDQTKAAFDSLRRNLGGIEEQARLLTRHLQLLGGAIAGAFAGSAASRFVGDAVRVFAQYDDKMRQAAAASGATGRELDQLRALAERMGEQTRYSASQAADGLKALALSGLSVKDQMTALPAVLQLAAAGSVNLEEAASIATNALAQFGLKATDLTAVNDVLVKAFTSSNTNVKELGLALQYAGSIANAAGNNFRDTATALAILANNGFSGEKAGTALRGILGTLLNPSMEVATALREVGVSVKDTSGRMLPLIEIMRRFRDSGATTAQLMKIFGLEAAPAMIAAVSTSREKFEGLVEVLGQYGGKAAEVATQMEAGIGGRLRDLESAWEGVKIAAARAVTGQETEAVVNLTRALTEHKGSIAAMAREWSRVGAVLVEAGIRVAEFLTHWREVIAVAAAVVVAVKGVQAAFALLIAIQAAGWFTAVATAAGGLTAVLGTQGLVAALASAGTAVQAYTSYQLSAYLFAGTTGALGLAAALGKVALAITAIVWAVPKIVEAGQGLWEVIKAKLAAGDAARLQAKEEARLADLMKEVSAQTGLAFQSAREFTDAITSGAIEVDRLTGKWQRSAKAVQEYAAGVEKVPKKLGTGESEFKEERLALVQALAEAEFAIQKGRIAREDAELERQLERHLVSRRDYYARKTALDQQQLDIEIVQANQARAKQERLAATAASMGMTGDELKAKAEIAKLEGELTVLNNRRAEAAVANAHRAAQAERAYRDELAAVREELLELTGAATHDDRVAAVERQYRGLRERMRAEGDTAGESLLSRLVGVKAAAADLTDYERQYGLVMSRMQSAESTLTAQRAAGLLTESQLRQQVIQLHQSTAAELGRLLPLMERSAQAIGSPEQLARVAGLRAEIDRLKLVVDDVALAIDGAVQDAFGKLFEEIGSGAKSAKEAFADFARSILSAINKIAAQKLAESLFGGLTSGGLSFGKIMSGLMGTPPGFASGGYVSGSGTTTSDSIPARLSRGEYVLNAAAVQAWGVGFLDFLNGLGQVALHGPRWDGPALAFAAGGMVPELPAQAPAQSGPNVRIVNVVDPALARDWLTSSSGEEVVLNILRRNAGAVQQIVG